MAEDYYICLDEKATRYALKHFNNKFVKILKCYTGFEVEMVVRAMNSNKGKKFYTLRHTQNSILRAEIKDLEILSSVPCLAKPKVLERLNQPKNQEAA